jgi:hypothetical protein
MFIVRNNQNISIHSVGEIKSFLMLELLVLLQNELTMVK